MIGLVQSRIRKQVFVKTEMNFRVQWQQVIPSNYELLKGCPATYRLITLFEEKITLSARGRHLLTRRSFPVEYKYPSRGQARGLFSSRGHDRAVPRSQHAVAEGH